MSEIYKCNKYNVLYVKLEKVNNNVSGWAIASVEDFNILSKYRFCMLKTTTGKLYVQCNASTNNG